MNWSQITPPQREAAKEWWNARTIAERERDWPVQTPMQRGLMSMHWRAWDGQSQASLAVTLLEAKLICVERKPASSESPKQQVQVMEGK